MSIFVANKVYLRGILLHYFIQKKSAAEAHRILVQTYDDNALSDTTCRDWFRRFKNNDFQLEDKERSGAPKKFQDKELEQLLDEKYYKLMKLQDPSASVVLRAIFLQKNRSTRASIAGEKEIREDTFSPRVSSLKVASEQFVSTKRHNFNGDSATVFFTVFNDAYREDDRRYENVYQRREKLSGDIKLKILA
ncbi:MOS1T transposase, partial [Pseudoatta argentina]